MKGKPIVKKVENDASGDKKHWLILTYKGDKRTHILKSMEKVCQKVTPKEVSVTNNVH